MPDTVQPTESPAADKKRKDKKSAEPKPKSPSMFKDPRVRFMSLAAAGLVLLYLAVIVSALLMGILANDQPQTMVDRDLNAYRTAVEGGSTLETDWAGYVAALIDMEQFGPAQTVLDQAATAGILDPRVRALDLQQSRLHKITGDFESAIEVAAVGTKALEKQLKDDQEDVLSGAQPTPLTAEGLPESYYGMMLITVESHEELGDDAAALKVLDSFLEQRPTASDILIWRGDVNARLGNTEEAKADYESGMRFIADETEKQAVQDKIDELGSN